MKNLMKWASLALFLVLTSCAAFSQPTRLTTPNERANLFGLVQTAETGIEVARLAGKLDTARYTIARSQLARIREQIAATEVRPVVPGELLQEVMVFVAEWVIAEKAK